MKILFLAPANNYHTVKWCDYFVSQGDDVSVISFFPGTIPNVKVYHIDCGIDAGNSDGKKLKYLLQSTKITKIAKDIDPDVISVHYASSYGAAAALSGLKGYYLSVWGADVYSFPRRSALHRALIRYSLRRASYVMSTSRAMARETEKYTSKKVFVTPFGVKMDVFSPAKRTRTEDADLVIGTVKALEHKYGIEYILKAAAVVLEREPDMDLKIRISGKGSCEEEYKSLCRQLGLEKITEWLGFIPQESAAVEWANMDVAVIPSVEDSESFGVAAIEAESCAVPVIISDVPGLMEATDPGNTSIVVKRKDENGIADAIIRLSRDKDLRKKMGESGREYVKNNYEFNDCFSKIRSIFLNNL